MFNTVRNQSHDNQQRSKPHRRIEKILDSLGLSYISEHPFSPYTVDIYLPEWHLAVEADGPFHSPNKDKVRDKWLKERYGLLVERIDVRVYRTAAYIEKHILSFIEEHAETSDERRMIWHQILH